MGEGVARGRTHSGTVEGGWRRRRCRGLPAVPGRSDLFLAALFKLLEGALWLLHANLVCHGRCIPALPQQRISTYLQKYYYTVLFYRIFIYARVQFLSSCVMKGLCYAFLSHRVIPLRSEQSSSLYFTRLLFLDQVYYFNLLRIQADRHGRRTGKLMFLI